MYESASTALLFTMIASKNRVEIERHHASSKMKESILYVVNLCTGSSRYLFEQFSAIKVGIVKKNGGKLPRCRKDLVSLKLGTGTA